MSYKEEADILTNQLYAETEKVEALQSELTDTTTKYGKEVECNTTLQSANKRLREALDIARGAMDKASLMYFDDKGGIDKMLAEEEDKIIVALKETL